MSIGLICEDTYAKLFFEELIKRLKSCGLLSNVKINVKTVKGGIPKIPKAVKAMLNNEKLILVFDADSQNFSDIKRNMLEKEQSIKKYIPKNFVTNTCIVLNYYEIEEWLLYSKKIRIFNCQKPSDILKICDSGYKKNCLPNYVNDLNLELLTANCKSFRKFIECLNKATGVIQN